MRCLPFVALILSGCAATAIQAPAGHGSVPTGATLSPSGFLTVGEMPPSAYPDDPPPMPTQLDTFARRTVFGTPEQRQRAWAEAGSTPEMRAEMERVMPALRAEPNFVDVRLTGEPGAKYLEAFFTRDARATLARHTTSPLFVARTGGRTLAELEPVMQAWFDRLERAGRPAGGASANTFEGVVELDTGITREEFDALARRYDWPDIADEPVRFTFAPEQPPAFADATLQPMIRIFARESTRPSIQLTALGTGRIVLQDGCFRLDGGGPLVMFGRNSQLGRDAEGYLAVSEERTGETYRIGEMGAWGGPNGVNERDADVRRLREACGPGEILNVRQPQSERLFSLPQPLWVYDYAHTYAITYEAAWRRVTDCMEKQERRGRRGLEARDACIDQYNGWEYIGEEMPPPPGS